MKLGKIIFRSILISALAAMVVAMAITLFVLNLYFTNTEKTQLRSQISLIAEGVENSGIAYLEDIDDIYRITWISADGTVLFDNSADSSQMDNHLSRAEVQQAIRYGFGESERYSDTISEKTVYEASRLSDGSIIRASFTIYSVYRMTIGLVPYLLLVAVAALLLCYFISKRLSNRIIEPLNTLDLEHPLENDAYEELSTLLVRIDNQNREIAKQLETLQRKEEEFSEITGNMNEGLILLGSSGNIVSLNSAAKRILSADDSAIGHSFITVERSLEVQNLVESVSKGGHAEIYLSKNGRIYRIAASAIFRNGENIGMCLLIVDVTEKAEAEKLRREFSANVSHELKTPLHSILGSVELLENNLVKSEDVPLFIGRIHKEAEHLVTLVEDIIRLSQLDEEKSFPREDISVPDLVSSIADSLSAEADSYGVTINTSSDDIRIHGVRRLLYEIVFNLVDNAIRYNRKGGKVDLSFHVSGDRLLLSVSDTGIGIACEHIDRIFERFYRVDKSHSRESGGTGLGLSIVKHAVMVHEGEIKVQSELGKGTTINIFFPITMLC